MTRLFGYLGTDYSRLQCALQLTGSELTYEATIKHSGWGLGFYQADQALIRKRPKVSSQQIRFTDLATDINSQALVGHLRQATVGDISGENTQPFRYKSWLFAHIGTLFDYQVVKESLMDHIPSYLQRYIMGQTDSEAAMYLFFGKLGKLANLDNPLIDPTVVSKAMNETIKTIFDTVRTNNVDPLPGFNTVLTNGKTMIATALGLPLFYKIIDGISDCSMCRNPPIYAGHTPKLVHHPRFKAIIVGSDMHEEPEGWTKVDRSVLQINHDMTITTIPISL